MLSDKEVSTVLQKCSAGPVWASSPGFVAINWAGASSACKPTVRRSRPSRQAAFLPFGQQQRQHALSRSRWLKTNLYRFSSFLYHSHSFSTLRRRGCTNCFGPKYSWLVYRTAPLGRQARTWAHAMHHVSTVYVQARCNGWVVSVAFLLSFFEVRGRTHRNHHLRPRGGTAVTACWVENIRCYTRIFPYHIICKKWKCTTCRLCLPERERTHTMSRVHPSLCGCSALAENRLKYI